MRDLRCCRGPTASVTNCGPASQCQAKDDGCGSDRLRPAGGRGPLVSDTQEPALGGTEAPRLLPEGVTLAPLPRTGGDAGGAGSPPGSGRARARAASWGPFRGSRARGALCSAGSGAEASSRPVSARGSGRPPFRVSRERRGRPCLCVGAPAQGGSAGRPAARCTRFLNKFPWRH